MDNCTLYTTMTSKGDIPHCDLPTRIINLDEVNWKDVDVDNKGNATGVFGLEFKEFLSKQLHTICRRLNLKGIKNVKKQDMVTMLIQAHKNWTNYKNLQNQKEDTASRKDPSVYFI